MRGSAVLAIAVPCGATDEAEDVRAVFADAEFFFIWFADDSFAAEGTGA
jgi:hypothetical protein